MRERFQITLRQQYFINHFCIFLPYSCKFSKMIRLLAILLFFFFFNDTATTEIYTLSLHDALPILLPGTARGTWRVGRDPDVREQDRKSTRLNSSHDQISYAVFCLKKKKKKK